jgi:hypothetical protein
VDVEAGEDRAITELVGEHPPLLREYVRQSHVSALGDEAARVAGTHSTGTARDNQCPIIETFTIVSPLTITPRAHVRPLVEVFPSEGDAWLNVQHAN